MPRKHCLKGNNSQRKIAEFIADNDGRMKGKNNSRKKTQ